MQWALGHKVGWVDACAALKESICPSKLTTERFFGSIGHDKAVKSFDGYCFNGADPAKLAIGPDACYTELN